MKTISFKILTLMIKSTPSFGNKHTLANVFLIDPKAWVLYELFLLFVVAFVLRRVPKIVILIALVVLEFGSFLCRLLFAVALCLVFRGRSVVHKVIVFRLGKLKFESFDLLNVIFLFDLMLKDFMVLIFDYFLHLELFFL